MAPTPDSTRPPGIRLVELVPGLVLLVALAVALQVTSLDRRGDSVRAAHAALHDVEVDANRQATLEWRAISEGVLPPTLTAERYRLRDRIASSMATLRARHAGDLALRDLAANLRAHGAALEAELELLRAGRRAAAVALHRRRVGPLSERIHTELVRTTEAYHRRAESTSRSVEATIWGTFLVGIAIVVALLVLFGRAREGSRRAGLERRYRSLVQNSSDVIVVLGPETRVSYVTPTVERILGHEPRALVGHRLATLAHPEDRDALTAVLEQAAGAVGPSPPFEWRARSGTGGWVDVESSSIDLSGDDAIGGLVVTLHDVTERKRFEVQLRHQAFHDGLTGLANRALFENRVEHAVAQARRRRRAVAVLYLDLDDFKTVNDSLGHLAGDQLLVRVAERLDAVLRASDTAARLGGDEFGVLVEDVQRAEDGVQVAERILATLREPFMVGERELFIRGTVGIAVSEENQGAAAELLRDADMAMYAAKRAGKGRHELFRPAMHAAAVRRLELKADLARAVEDERLVVHYQPVVALEDRRILGVEALVRWEHPTHGMVGPGDFIPVAEESGLIVEIGRQVLRRACVEARGWRERAPELRLNVNLSPRQLAEPGVVADVLAATRDAGLDPRALTLEVTESSLGADPELVRSRLQDLRDIGVRIAVDDFGTGYSSLSYLRDFPVDIVKLDKSFVDGVGQERGPAALVRSVVELGAALELEIVVEGIEREEQLTELRALGCRVGQGYLFARPVPPAELGELLRQPTLARSAAA